MKKQFRILGMLLLSFFAFTTLTACGSDDNDDEPQISNVRESDLTKPWMIINVEEGQEDELYFITFNGNRAARGILNDNGSIYDVMVYNNWKLDGDKLYLNGNLAGTIQKVQHQGVQMILINDIFYLPSNVRVDGRSVEDELSAVGITREMLWEAILNSVQ